MGMERTVTFVGSPPAWETLAKEFAAAGLQIKIRMIDGLPAFPDETPSEGWKEIRLSTQGGMMTLRQDPGQIAIVVWGNADDNLRREWELLANACTSATSGTLQPDPGESCSGH